MHIPTKVSTSFCIHVLFVVVVSTQSSYAATFTLTHSLCPVYVPNTRTYSALSKYVYTCILDGEYLGTPYSYTQHIPRSAPKHVHHSLYPTGYLQSSDLPSGTCPICPWMIHVFNSLLDRCAEPVLCFEFEFYFFCSLVSLSAKSLSLSGERERERDVQC
jgi:hypothetical protein